MRKYKRLLKRSWQTRDSNLLHNNEVFWRLNRTEQIKQWLKIKTNDEYELAEEYKNNQNVLIRHVPCGTVFRVSFINLEVTQNIVCRHCQKVALIEQIKKLLLDKTGGEFELAGDFTNKGRIPIRHKVCGTVSYISFYRLEKCKRVHCWHCEDIVKTKV